MRTRRSPRPASHRAALAAAAAILVLASGAGCARRARIPEVPPPTGPVEIETDVFGVPHVRASNMADLYFAWGWVTARDRSWQLILTRARVQGLSHRFLGDDALLADGGAQLFQLRERAERIAERDCRDPELRLALQRYTDGINAWLGSRGRQATPRGEFEALRLDPEPWRIADTYALLLGYGVTLDLSLPELGEAKSIREHGAGWIEHRRRFENRYLFDTIPDSAGGAIPAPMRADSVPLAVAQPLPGALLASARDAERRWPERSADGSDRASNAFAAGPKRTANGLPILANDPHLTLTTPGPFHVVHLVVPGLLDVAGAASPGLPCVISGRNENCAWGVTSVNADFIDLYADTISADGRKVRWNGGWAPVRTAKYDLHMNRLGFPIPVPPFVQQRRWTPHGPVVAWDPAAHLALSARWSAMEDDSISVREMVGLERSRSAEEIARRFRTLVTPGFNCVAADDEGRVIYEATGLMPIRPFPFTYGPLPSDGRHEWAGFVPADSMPRWNVPANGYVVNGNNRPRRTPGWDRFDWVNDRAARMSQMLGETKGLTLQGAVGIQNDVYTRAGARTTPLLLAAADQYAARLDDRGRTAVALLRAWGFHASHDRVSPTLNRAWWSAYVRRTGTEGLPGLAIAALAGEADDTLSHDGSRVESPAEAAVAALAVALDSLGAKLGPDIYTWTWGRAHRAHFAHALGRYGGRDWSAVDVEEDGDGSTVAVAPSQAPWSFEVSHGPGFRHVVDLAVRESSLVVVPPWNSDQFRIDHRLRWAEHKYFPLLRDWDRIGKRRLDRVTLGPKTSPKR